MWHYHVAHILRACRLHTFSKAIIDLLYQVLLPVRCTKFMTTGQTVSLISSQIKFRVTYTAKSLVIHLKSTIDVWKCSGQLSVKFNANFVFELVFLVEPIVHELVIIPFEVFKYLYRFVRIALEQIFDLFNFFHLPLLYLFDLVHYEVILNIIKVQKY